MPANDHSPGPAGSAEAPPDFTVQRLGEPRFVSPLEFNEQPNDYISDFIEDGARIAYDASLLGLRQAAAAGVEPASMEVAGPRRRLYFDPGKVRAAAVTCGGLCPGLNDVLRALTLELWHRYGVRDIVGVRYGYWGLLPENFHEAIPLNPDAVKDIHRRGGTLLCSSRGEQDVGRTVDLLEARKIDMLFTIGGDGTQRGAHDIAEEIARRGRKIAVIGLPKTIDNDIAYTERTFGYETAFSIARDVLLGGHTEARCAMNGVGLVQLMGRHSGYIAARAALATGEVNFVLVPEVPFDLDGPRGFLKALEERLRSRRHALVVVAEGAGQNLLEAETARLGVDKSGNLELADIGLYLKKRITEHFAANGMEANVKYIDPSYIIRSAPANAVDAVFCQELARNAIHAAMSGRTDAFVGEWNQHQVHVPLATAVAKRKLIDPNSSLWGTVVEATGQPAIMTNPQP